MNRRLVLAVLTALGALAAVPTALAQSRPVKLVVGYPPGGPVDLLARAIAPALSAKLGQPVTIENKAGASGTIGMDTVIKGTPDGSTIGMGTPGGITSLPHLMKLPYDPDKIHYISLVARVPQVFVTNNEVKDATLADFIRSAKAAPKKYNYGSAGNATTTHLGAELLRQETGIDIVHVAYKGATPAITALMGNEVQLFPGDLSGVLTLIQAGKLRALAIETAQRIDVLPNVPTTAELGYPKIMVESAYGIIAPTGTPPAISARLQQAVAEVVNLSDVKAQIARQGAIPSATTADEYRAMMQAESAKWAAVIKAGGIRLE